MPQIIVKADSGDAVMLRERVNPSDLESKHFATQLIERLGWAVGDAHDLEREPEEAQPARRERVEARLERALELAGN